MGEGGSRGNEIGSFGEEGGSPRNEICNFGGVAYVSLAAEAYFVILRVILCDLCSGKLESVLI